MPQEQQLIYRNPFRFFAPTSVWNEELPSNAELDPSSSAMVAAFDKEVIEEEQRKFLNINTTAWSVPIYTVPVSQPSVKVLLNKPNGSLASLQTAWKAVPLPANAVGAKGTDKHLVVWQPSTNKLWEFWSFEPATATEGPKARWGGAIEHASASPGAYDPSAWQQLVSNFSSWTSETNSWGASGCSLSIAGGLITLEDLKKGVINHALKIGIPHPRAGVWASPAKRTDGNSTNPLSLPEGAHLRLDPNLDLSSLHLPRITMMIAEAAQRYGIIVGDTGGNIALYGQDPTPTGTNPYAGPTGYFEGMSQLAIMKAFPWSHLQVLKMELK